MRDRFLSPPAFQRATRRVRSLSGSTSTIGESTTATHSPDQTLTSPLPPGCLLSAPHRLTPPGSQLRPRHAYSRSTWVHCQDSHAHLHHLAPCTPRPPLFSAYSVARPCGVCFTKSDGFGGKSVNFQSKKKIGCNRKLGSARNFRTRFLFLL